MPNEFPNAERPPFGSKKTYQSFGKMILSLIALILLIEVSPAMVYHIEGVFVDWFIIADKVQDMRWYFYDTSQIITKCLLWFIVNKLCEFINLIVDGKEKIWLSCCLISFIYLITEIFEIFDYWLFANSIPTLPAVLLIAGTYLFYFYVNRKYFRKND